MDRQEPNLVSGLASLSPPSTDSTPSLLLLSFFSRWTSCFYPASFFTSSFFLSHRSLAKIEGGHSLQFALSSQCFLFLFFSRLLLSRLLRQTFKPFLSSYSGPRDKRPPSSHLKSFKPTTQRKKERLYPGTLYRHLSDPACLRRNFLLFLSISFFLLSFIRSSAYLSVRISIDISLGFLPPFLSVCGWIKRPVGGLSWGVR